MRNIFSRVSVTDRLRKRDQFIALVDQQLKSTPNVLGDIVPNACATGFPVCEKGVPGFQFQSPKNAFLVSRGSRLPGWTIPQKLQFTGSYIEFTDFLRDGRGIARDVNGVLKLGIRTMKYPYSKIDKAVHRVVMSFVQRGDFTAEYFRPKHYKKPVLVWTNPHCL